MEALAGPSGYKGPGVGGISRAESVGRLAQCGHQYHLQCLVAMYNNGNKDGSLQCPTCKTIYGVKTGNQPPGKMEYHVIPHSLPGHPDCKTIRIIYNIPPGIQVKSCICLPDMSFQNMKTGSVIGFAWMRWWTLPCCLGPRAPKSWQTIHCPRVPQTLLPPWQREGTQGKWEISLANVMFGFKLVWLDFVFKCHLFSLILKVLRLLLVAWDRRLIFSVGTSSTTGESDTVIWNEVHHKTEFGSNLTGHGYPDPGHLDNVLEELKAQGITEEECLPRDWTETFKEDTEDTRNQAGVCKHTILWTDPQLDRWSIFKI